MRSMQREWELQQPQGVFDLVPDEKGEGSPQTTTCSLQGTIWKYILVPFEMIALDSKYAVIYVQAAFKTLSSLGHIGFIQLLQSHPIEHGRSTIYSNHVQAKA